MDDTRQRLNDELDRAEKAWHDHRLTGYVTQYRHSSAGYVTHSHGQSATPHLSDPDWRDREQELWERFVAARRAWSQG